MRPAIGLEIQVSIGMYHIKNKKKKIPLGLWEHKVAAEERGKYLQSTMRSENHELAVFMDVCVCVYVYR